MVGILANKQKSFYVLAVIAVFLCFITYSLGGSWYKSNNATFHNGPAPWDGYVPTVTINGQAHIYSFMIVSNKFYDKAVTLKSGESFNLDQLYLFSVCKIRGACLLEKAQGTLTLSSYTPEQFIAGTIHVKHSEGEETIAFSAPYSR